MSWKLRRLSAVSWMWSYFVVLYVNLALLWLKRWAEFWSLSIFSPCCFLPIRVINEIIFSTSMTCFLIFTWVLDFVWCRIRESFRLSFSFVLASFTCLIVTERTHGLLYIDGVSQSRESGEQAAIRPEIEALCLQEAIVAISCWFYYKQQRHVYICVFAVFVVTCCFIVINLRLRWS